MRDLLSGFCAMRCALSGGYKIHRKMHKFHTLKCAIAHFFAETADFIDALIMCIL